MNDDLYNANRATPNAKMKTLRFLFLLILAPCFLTQNADALADNDAPPYRVEDGWIVGRNLPRYNNRPLYLRQSRAFLLTGDKPIVRMAADSRLYGTVYFVFERQGKRLRLDQFSDATFSFRADEARWEMEDSSLPGARVSLTVLPSGPDGFVVNLSVEGMEQGDAIEWFYGDPKDLNGNADWAYDASGRPELLSWGVDDGFAPLRQGRFDAVGSYVLLAKTNSQRELDLTLGNESDFVDAREANRQFHERLKISTPCPALDAVESMKDGDVLTTPQGARFIMKDEPKNIAFVSLWDNYPNEITIPTGGAQGDAVAFLICGSTNIMQCHIENAVLEIWYGDDLKDEIRLVPPVNYWNLCPIDGHATAPGQASRSYYTSETDRFCLPRELPQTVTLGQNCVAMLTTARLRENQPVEKVVLRCMSQEVVVGLMGISIGKEKR